MCIPYALNAIVLLLVLAGSAAAAFANAVKLTEASNHIAVEIDGKPFTDYWFGPRKDRPYVRPFFAPVRAADGTPVTSDQYGQKEHPHHQSLWVGEGDVNGADHWSLEHGPKNPRQRHIKFEKVAGDTIIEEVQWEGKTGEPMLREKRTMRFISFPDGARGIEFKLNFTPIDGQVTFGDTKEAGLVAVRVARAISDHPTLTNSKGRHGEKDTWGKAADWCDISGKIDGKEYGVAAFDSPHNPRRARWHVREYGLMGANPFGLSYFDKDTPRHFGDFVMQPGNTVTFVYEIVVHMGNARSAKLIDRYREFAELPE